MFPGSSADRGAGRGARRLQRVAASALALALAPLLTGCATVGGARPWGEQSTVTPGKRPFGAVVSRTMKAPQTWAPLVAAALLQVEHMDTRAAAWATDRTPVFGSRGAADDAGDALDIAAGIAAAMSILAAPSGTDAHQWTANKAKGGFLDLGAVAVAQGVTTGVKAAARRERPDGSDDRSFPSGHATRSSVAATIAQRNVRAAFDRGPAVSAVEFGTFALAAGCAWSRVEAGRHHPADVLAGFAIGHLVGAIVSDALVSPAAPVSLRVSFVPGRGGGLAVSWRP